MSTTNRSSLMHRYLDPAPSLGEIMFGLIMTLTFTLGAGIIIDDEGREGARELLIALVGCNIAWGVIDAAVVVWDDARFALRVSNGILLALLFLVGFNWARYTSGNRWTGLAC
jgi:hypothetical protein